MRCLGIILLLSWLCGVTAAQRQAEQFDAYDYNRRLGQSVNLGNTLEAPREGDWGFTLQPWHFESIAQGGFDSVRVPIRWSAHAQEAAPYTIDAGFLDRIDWVVDQAQQQGLAVILNVHHYDEIHHDIPGHRDRLAGIWSQIAERYQDEPRSQVYFEILNEPNADFTDTHWRSVYEQTLAAIRATNPDRMVIVGGIGWNSANGLIRLRLPENDPHLIGTFHYYDPFPFTHQGAEWVDDSTPWLGTRWSGEDREQRGVEGTLDRVQRWSERYDRPVFMGEFGAYSNADMESRARWTEFVATAAEDRAFSWGYWEFGAGFGVMDRTTRAWIEPLYDALSPQSLLNLDDIPGYTSTDVDLLSNSILTGVTADRFDVNGDGKVLPDDLDYWIYFTDQLPGDTNLDGTVDFDDFLVVAGGFGGTATKWSDGDFNANGQVDFSDFLQLSGHFDGDPVAAASVPEPNFGVAWLWFVAVIRWFSARRTAR